MVYLNRIYTKSGDSGETSLGDGARVPKTDFRIIAYGTIDELNSVLGVARSAGLPKETDEWIHVVQNDLFDLGADLCVPESHVAPEIEPGRAASDRADRDRTGDAAPAERPRLRISAEQITHIEEWIDAANESLEPLESFVLPGGTPAAAHLHHARTVCRRAEIAVLQLAETQTVNPHVAVYLNRLSDLLFVLARAANDNGRDDLLWVPGAGRSDGEWTKRE